MKSPLYLLALHAVFGADDEERLDDIAALVEEAYSEARAPRIRPHPDLLTIRREIAAKRRELAHA